MRRGFKSWAERKSIEFRKELLKDYYEKLGAIELAKHLDIVLIEPNDIPGLNDKEKNILLNHDHQSWSAITIKNHLGELVIIYNPTHSDRRQESDSMHELAHIICKHNMEKIKRKDFPFQLRDYNAEQEDEAKWLGGCLQIPRKALEWCKYRRMSDNELADHFGASFDMITYRINITGIKKQIAYGKYLKVSGD